MEKNSLIGEEEIFRNIDYETGILPATPH